MDRRELHFDTIKLLAFVWIYAGHFIYYFDSSLLKYWYEGAIAFFLNGFTGKLMVAIFSVILGYFSFKKGLTEKSLVEYVLKRYIYFFVMGLFINICICVINGATTMDDCKNIFYTSLTIGSNIFPTFWCMQSFFYASVFSYINGKYRVSVSTLIVQIVIFYLVGQVWISVGLMGNLLHIMLENNESKIYQMMNNKVVQGIVILIAFFAIKQPENEAEMQSTFFVYGMSAMIGLTVISINTKIRKLFSVPAIAALGRRSMGMYLIHTLVYSIIGSYLMDTFSFLSYRNAFVLVFAICLILIVLFSFPSVYTINTCSKRLFQVFLLLKNNLMKMSEK